MEDGYPWGARRRVGSRGRGVSRLAAQPIALIAAVAFVFAGLGHDLRHRLCYSPVTWCSPVTGSHFRADVRFGRMTIDRAAGTAGLPLVIEVRGADARHPVEDLRFSHQALDGSISVHICERSDLSLGELVKDDGTTVDAAEASFALELPVEGSWSSMLYPFDRYEITLEPSLAVNGDAEPPEARPSRRPLAIFPTASQLPPGVMASATLHEVVFDVGPDYDVRIDEAGNRIRIVLRTSLFIRIMSIVLSAILAAALVHAIRKEDTKELIKQSLGLILAIWGLRAMLVPDSLGVHPTLVDYVGLGCLVVIPLTIALRTYLPRQERSSR